MSLEKKLRDELHDTAERLALDPGEYGRAMERGALRRRQRWGLLTGGALGFAAVLVLANALELGGDDPQLGTLLSGAPNTTLATMPPATTLPSSPATAPPVTVFEQALAIAADDGIAVLAADQGSTFLSSDPFYQSISWAISDEDGGLLFTHEVTPLPWEQGTLMRLPAEASQPIALVAPEGGGVITPLAVEEGSVFYRLDDLGGHSRIMAVGLDGADSREIVGATPLMASAAVADGVVAVSLGGECGGYLFYATTGGPLPTPEWASVCGPGIQNDIALADGYLFTLSDIDSQRQLVRIELETGEQVSTPIEDGWQVEAESSGRVAVGGTEIRVGDYRGEAFVETESFLGRNGTFALLPSLVLAANPRLGSGMGELPCTAIDVPDPTPPADLPEAVADKYLLVFSLAKSCEMEQLGALILADDAAFTFGAVEDPVETWVRSARYGFDVMSMTVRILNAEPALSAGIYSWPAVHVTNSSEDWSQLSGLLSAAEYEQLYQYRDEFGYLGLRVGIAEDGRLAYLIAGD